MEKFQHFKTDVKGISIPAKFTFPFYYEPHPLAKIATQELQEYLKNQKDFTHHFGLENTDENTIGKMFGVLVVQNKNDVIGYLCAFSGNLDDNSLPEKFVPPIYNRHQSESFFNTYEKELNVLTGKINRLQQDDTYQSKLKSYKDLKKEISQDIENTKITLKERRKKRREKKAIFLNDSGNLGNKAQEFIKKLTQQSFNDQFYFKELQEYYHQKLQVEKEELQIFEDELNTLQKTRTQKSNELQQLLFEQYHFLNQQKETKSLLEILNHPEVKPPAGSGDCAAPKLLQYAFENDFKPICMAEFWWGVSPNTEIRKHKNYYPACQSRCKPILTHMLAGIDVEDNKLLENLNSEKELELFYEDEDIIIVNKPEEFLSVPGKEIKDSVLTRVKLKYPKATGPMLVHRLDMSTSGILVFTKTLSANKFLQKQFIERTIKKRYVAILEGIIKENEGEISLPIRLDLDDRPKQLVDFKHGKTAKTKWKVIERKNNKTRIHFFPITGRTHQLRVHAAHKDGLKCPILGDDLYGTKADRLHLHAELIEFIHPKSKDKVSFTIPAPF